MSLKTPLKDKIEFKDSPSVDAFKRARVSNPTAIFDIGFQYNKQPLFLNENLTGGATITHLPNESSVRLRCGTASGDKAIFQSKQYFRYQPGKSQLIAMSGVMGVAKSNVRQRNGYFDANNGIFFEQDEGDLKVVRRTKTSGSVVDNAVNQEDWNIDEMNGTGPSGITLDTSKTNIFLIDLEWLGVGRVRCGVIINGNIYYIHEFNNANILTLPYMTTANLPPRYEIENTGASASNTDLKVICMTVITEGGIEIERGLPFGASNGTTGVAAILNTLKPVLSIRVKTLLNNIENRENVRPIGYDIMASAKDVHFQILLNPTLTDASWVDANTNNSGVQKDVSATAISGGMVLEEGYVPSGKNSARVTENGTLLEKVVLGLNYVGDTGDILTIAADGIGGNATVYSALNWKEIY